MELFDSLKSKIKGKNLKIIFPEATDERILGAVVRLYHDQLLTPVLIGDKDEVSTVAKEHGFDLTGIDIINPNTYDKYDEMVEAFVERRKGKATEEQARKQLRDVNYFGTMLVYMDKADGLVSGAIHSTGETVRPALQIIKTRPGVSRTSGAFIMLRGRDQEKYVFSD
ncbi:MAG: phosphate acyltransferase, partial [Alkalibacterium sp.]|uniref:phosphate acyltransferase n=1 Tax=Alkalibacterium sp. TaxID=1872447 RepID=UPI003970F329